MEFNLKEIAIENELNAGLGKLGQRKLVGWSGAEICRLIRLPRCLFFCHLSDGHPGVIRVISGEYPSGRIQKFRPLTYRGAQNRSPVESSGGGAPKHHSLQ